MRAFYLIIAMLTIFSSCKKNEEPVDPCTNGYLDPGETAPDCGGNCPPCQVTAPEYFTLFIDGQVGTMNTRVLNFDNPGWSLQMTNDSISMQLSLGTTGLVQTSPIPALGTYAYVNGLEYPIQANGTYSISEHNLASQNMSGFFGIDFVRQISSGPDVYDTLKISGGQFEFFNY
jgi:hypothetical protein